MGLESLDSDRRSCAGDLTVTPEVHEDATRPTRRRFLKWTGGTIAGLSVGSAAFLGRLVAFTPTAQAVTDFDCRGYSGTCSFNCVGACEIYQSCCYSGGLDYCCCTCYAGPGACNPSAFRSHARCRTFVRDLCCCAYC
jgi:hypothetical protein